MINLQDLTNPIKQAIDALEEIIDLVRDVTHGEYIPDYFTTQPCEIALKALREYQGEWISVEDKPVPIDEKVMLCFPLANGEYYICSGYVSLEDGGVWADNDVGEIGYPACDISHWQPLPEPPMNKGE
jgi:hypothetical protein